MQQQAEGLNIIIDCERMKYPNTGLYYFCLHLGQAIVAANNTKDKLNFYLPEKEMGVFGSESDYIKQNSLQKFLLPSTRNFDIWHCTFQGTSYFPAKRKIRKVLTIHDLNFMHDTDKSEAKKQKYLSELQHKIDKSSHIVTISNFTAAEVRKYLKVSNKPITTIYNGCNINPIENLSAPALLPAKPFIYTIGTIVEKKNMHVLPCLLKGNDYQLVLSGITQSEEYKQRIIAEAQQWGVADRLIFTGAVSDNDKQWYMKNCLAFAFPSIAEGFGLPVVEAMYFGKPLLLSTYTSLPEIGGDVAYYFDNFEGAHMQEVLVNSLAHYQATNPAEAIMKRVNLFNWQEAARQYLAVYHSLVKLRV